jgi:hypothetical protein
MEKKVGKYTVKTEKDLSPESPRKWDNLGTMVCFSRNYNLGDKHDYNFHDYDSWNEMEKDIIKREKPCVILPLYLYDHSGITMNTTGFSCPWDSGQVGFIYMTKEVYIENFGGKIMTPKRKEHAKGLLIGEVETYDQYLTGDVYGFIIFDENDNEIDSCWGFYSENECLEDGIANVPEEV